MQKVLTMETDGPSLRSEAQGWSAEDGNEAIQFARGGKPVGLMGYGAREAGDVGRARASRASPYLRDWYSYETPYHALGDGWKLLSPPQFDPTDKVYEWWFVKD